VNEELRLADGAQAGIPTRVRLRTEVLETDRIVPESQDQARQGVTLRLKAPANRTDHHFHGYSMPGNDDIDERRIIS